MALPLVLIGRCICPSRPGRWSFVTTPGRTGRTSSRRIKLGGEALAHVPATGRLLAKRLSDQAPVARYDVCQERRDLDVGIGLGQKALLHTEPSG